MTIGTKNHLHNLLCNAILFTVPLSKEQKSRWIKHPQAMTLKDNLLDLIPPYQRYALICMHNAVYGGMGREPKKTPPPLCLVLEAMLCGYPIHLGLFKSRIIQMLYTFLIATRNQTLSTLSRIRTVSATADSEEQARSQLNGLPLVFVSCKANKAGV